MSLVSGLKGTAYLERGNAVASYPRAVNARCRDGGRKGSEGLDTKGEDRRV